MILLCTVFVLYVMVGLALAIGAVTAYALMPDRMSPPSRSLALTYVLFGPMLLAVTLADDPSVLFALFTARRPR